MLLSGPAAAQTVTTNPQPVFSTSAGGSVAVTNTFQSVFAAKANPAQSMRFGCTIQNSGASNAGSIFVFVGPIASATKAASFELVPVGTGVQGGSFSCATGGGGVIQDQISVTGTSGDTFAATSQ